MFVVQDTEQQRKNARKSKYSINPIDLNLFYASQA